LALLEVNAVSIGFGGILAVNRVSFELNGSTILGIIGPNGSGKTTLLNILNGVHPPDEGEITFNGVKTTRLKSHQLTKMGIMRTFQNPHVFQTITVYQNMMVPLLHANVPAHESYEKAMELLKFVGLEEKAEIPASELSGGQQKLLEFARALMTDPQLVMMDEPFGGMHPQIKGTLIQRIREMRERGIAFMIVSHEIPNLMELSQQVICLNYGKLIANDTPIAVSQNESVIEAYLGH